MAHLSVRCGGHVELYSPLGVSFGSSRKPQLIVFIFVDRQKLQNSCPPPPPHIIASSIRIWVIFISKCNGSRVPEKLLRTRF